MAECIEREIAISELDSAFPAAPASEFSKGIAVGLAMAELAIQNIPAADVREVVLCGECYLHTHCRTEDVFDFAGLREENRFCSVGKRKTNGAKMMGVQDG